MRVGEIALKRGWLNEFDRQSRQQQLTAPIWLAIHCEDLPAITLDRSMQFGDIVWGRRSLEFDRDQTGRRMTGRRRGRTTPAARGIFGCFPGIAQYGREGAEKKKAQIFIEPPTL